MEIHCPSYPPSIINILSRKDLHKIFDFNFHAKTFCCRCDQEVFSRCGNLYIDIISFFSVGKNCSFWKRFLGNSNKTCSLFLIILFLHTFSVAKVTKKCPREVQIQHLSYPSLPLGNTFPSGSVFQEIRVRYFQKSRKFLQNYELLLSEVSFVKETLLYILDYIFPKKIFH